MSLLEIKKLSLCFGGLTAVKDVDLSVEQGEIYSIIGPNGAGKTSVFNVITGIYEPTQGEIQFQGRTLLKPLTPRVWIGCAIIGLLTGLIVAVAFADVEKLWRAAIKRNMTNPQRPFTYSAAAQGALSYLRREPAVDRLRNGKWIVVSADRGRTLSERPLATEEEATIIRDRFAAALRAGAPFPAPVEQDGRWVVYAPEGKTELAHADSAAEAEKSIVQWTQLQAADRFHTRRMWAALLLGAAIGFAGSFVVWKRSRRSCDVIAQAGIARTFQNIRLFTGMTVLENVLVGLDRQLQSPFWEMLIRFPTLIRREQQAIGEASELLEFVGLDGKGPLLAKNLPYGDQRRLEIARALAVRPQLLLLDEPAAGMNPSESGELMHLIRRIRDQGITVLLIEHHIKLVMDISDRIAVLEYGQKIAEGTPTEVRNNPRVIEAYLGKEEVS